MFPPSGSFEPRGTVLRFVPKSTAGPPHDDARAGNERKRVELLTGLGTDTLSWRIGHVPELAPLKGRTIPVRLVVFAEDYPDGLVWADAIQLAIR